MALAGSKAASRHQRILALIGQRGYVSNEELAREFDVTVQTVRRDVNALAEEGRVARHHGGAGLASSTENIAYAERQVLNPQAKEAIARQAAAEIPDRSSLFVNIGTTTEALARALLGHRELRVITNNLNVAALLSSRTDFSVVVTGGTVRNRDGGIVGQTVSDMIAEFRVDFGILGISGIDEDGTLLDFDPDEIRAARAILRHSRQSFLLADHTKFARRPMVRLGSITEVSALFTDQPPPRPIQALLREHGVACHVAGRAPAAEAKPAPGR